MPQLHRNRTAQIIVAEVELPERGQLPQRRRNRTAQRVAAEVELPELAQVPQRRRKPAGISPLSLLLERSNLVTLPALFVVTPYQLPISCMLSPQCILSSQFGPSVASYKAISASRSVAAATARQHQGEQDEGGDGTDHAAHPAERPKVSR